MTFDDIDGRPDYHDYLNSGAWRWQRKRALARAANRCERCGGDGDGDPLEVHHLTYARLGDERLSDLLVVCGECHEEIHDRMDVWA